MDDALATTEAFDTHQIRVWAGFCASQAADEAVWTRSIDGFHRFSEQAADAGVTLAVEMYEGRSSDTVEGCLRLIEWVERDNFELNYQPSCRESSEEGLEKARRIASHVVSVYAQNYSWVRRQHPQSDQRGYERLHSDHKIYSERLTSMGL